MQRCRAVLLALLSIFVIHGAYADSTTELQQRQQERALQQEREQRLAEPRVQLQPTVPSPTGNITAIDKYCFDVDRVQLVVPAAVKQQWPFITNAFVKKRFVFLKSTILHYQGQCIGKNKMQEIISALLAHSLAAGYTTTRFYIPNQDLGKRVFKINIVPGFIHAIRINGDADRNMIRFAFPIYRNELLNIRDLEQGLEQIKHLQSVDIKMNLVPAKNVIGGTDIVLDVSRIKPWQIYGSADNAGVETTGVYIARGGAIFDNPLGLADQLSLGVNSDTKGEQSVGQRGMDLQYSVPFGYWLFSLTGSYARYSQLFGEQNQLISSGNTQDYSIKLSQVVYRDTNDKMEWYGKLQQRHARSYLDDLEILVQRRNTSAVELGFHSKHYFDRSVLDVVIASRWGVPWFGGERDPVNLSSTSPTFQYNLQTLDLSFNQSLSAFNISFQYQTVIRGQWTRSHLYGADFFSIGSRYSVRGFGEDNTLQAEKGLYWRNELSCPIWRSGQQFYLGLDAGQLGGPTTRFLQGDHLVGGFIGLRGSLYEVSYDLFSGWPISQPSGFGVDGPNIGFSLSASY